MNERIADRYPSAAPALQRTATVVELASRRRSGHMLDSVTFFLGGQYYGTFTINAPIPAGTELRLYVVGQGTDPAYAGHGLAPLDCLVTDGAPVDTTDEHGR